MIQCGWTELRVHGVSGTPPESLLELVPEREWPEAEPSKDDEGLHVFRGPVSQERLRAVSWASLTSGKARYSFYILLLPFMLANVAGWTVRSKEETISRNKILVVRCGALLLSVLFACFLAVTVIDVIGGQLLPPITLLEGQGNLLEFASVAACGLVVGLLGHLTRVRPRKGKTSEIWSQPAQDWSTSSRLTNNQERMWNTPILTGLLHRIHIAAILTTVALLVLVTARTPISNSKQDESSWDRVVNLLGSFPCRYPDSTLQQLCSDGAVRPQLVHVTWIAVGATALLCLAALVWLSTRGKLPQFMVWGVRTSWIPAAGGLAAAALFRAMQPSPGEWLTGARGVLVGLAAVLIAYSLIILIAMPSLRVGGVLLLFAAGTGSIYGTGLGSLPLFGSLTSTTLRTPPSYDWLALVLTGILAATILVLGLWFLLQFSKTRTDPGSVTAAIGGIVQKPVRLLQVAAAPGFIGGLLIVALAFWLLVIGRPEVCIERSSGRPLPDVKALDPCLDTLQVGLGQAGSLGWWIVLAPLLLLGIAVSVSQKKRVREVGIMLVVVVTPALAVATWVPSQPFVGRLSVVAAVAALLAGIGLWSRQAWLLRWGAALAIGFAVVAWIAGNPFTTSQITRFASLALPVGFVLARVRGSLRNREQRRTIAVLWDLANYWPRWFHPLTPPTYSDTAVYELNEIIDEYAKHGTPVLLTPHSQGSIIAFTSLLLRNDSDGVVKQEVALLTYGSPLHIYEQIFPRQFSASAFNRLANSLSKGGDAGKGDIRWKNVFRPSDPIGGPIPYPTDKIEDINERLDEGTGHSDYWGERCWKAHRLSLVEQLHAEP